MLHQLVTFRQAREDQDAEVRPYSRNRVVRWELNIDSNTGQSYLVDLVDVSQQSTRFGRETLVPNSGRTSGLAPSLGADDLQYVLGWADEKSKPARVAAAHTAFVQLCRCWRDSYPDEPAAQAVTAFYESGTRPQPPTESKWTSKDLMIIVVDGLQVTDCDSLWSTWATVVQQRKTGTAASGAGRRGVCLICGQVGTLLDRMPQALPKALVPGAEQEIALVSANRRIHTFDFTEGLSNSPICVGCGQAAVANLHTILSDDKYTFSYAKQRTRLAWWVTDGGDSQTIALLDRRPDAIREYLRSLTEGRKHRRPGPHQFCSMTISGNVARLVVHHWLQMPLAEAEDHVDDWFRDLCIVGRGQHDPTGYPIWLLALCAGQWQTADNPRQGRYIPMGDKAADRPDDIAHALLHTALHGGTVGPYLLAHVVRRVRTDLHIDGPRAALLRVALNRHPHRTGEGPDAVLDEKEDNPAYLYGRLFAVLESLQLRAFGRDDMPNTSFFHRYFAGAVANPRVALVQGLQMYPAWLKKLDAAARPDSKDTAVLTQAERARRAAARFRARIRELQDRLDRPVQPLADAESQSWFVLGYFHQQAHDIRMAQAGKAPEIPTEALTTDTDDLASEGTAQQ
ncbi:hypothetical protein HH310_33405 [Actinoplanes sp. TBRC 11911]|uniref:type I-C CRISPR-associated protein Cas8c/Csd1 n=1 Tax=Actinoplanes sp. TBRC 11911 TaxID=2729386 RepID=UPI00145F805D|nr:type I-C CRISPR-associated protein Cas8c/Csd1 [Actinoplanes sp. TBRC 11911]NMO56065.1 hypothetical protein [Actinoplanes sp. TBRC 11911]